jgi:hypothetical protein
MKGREAGYFCETPQLVRTGGLLGFPDWPEASPNDLTSSKPHPREIEAVHAFERRLGVFIGGKAVSEVLCKRCPLLVES